MAYYKAPKEFGLHIVVSMNDAVACIDNCSRIWNNYQWVGLTYPVYGLSHNFGFTLHNAFSHYVVFKEIKSIWKTDEATLHVVYGVQNILKIRKNFLISHK